MMPFVQQHMQRHAVAIRYLPAAQRKASAHQLCMKIVTQLAANDAPVASVYPFPLKCKQGQALGLTEKLADVAGPSWNLQRG